MIVVVSWDGPSADDPERGSEVEISTEAELEETLDQIAISGTPFAVQIYRPDAEGSVLLGIGCPDRSFVDWLTPDGERFIAAEEGVPPWSEPVGFDLYGDWHERAGSEMAVTPQAAREAAREYLATASRPSFLRWLPSVA